MNENDEPLDGRYYQLREEIQQRIAELDAGQGIEIEDDEQLAAFFEEIETEVRREAEYN